MITLTATYEGKTYPLDRMGWYRQRPDGVFIGVVRAVLGNGEALTTPEQAKDFTHWGRKRDMAKDDCTYVLAPLDEIHDRMGGGGNDA